MAHELKNLDLEEVSLVDEPANPGAKVLLIKRADRRAFAKQFAKAITDAGGDAAPLEAIVKEAIDFDEAQQNREAMDVFWRSFDALHESVMSIISDEETSDKGAAISESLEQFAASVREQLSKAKSGQSNQEGEDDMSEKDAQKRLEGLEKTVETLTKALEDAGAKVEKDKDGAITKVSPAEPVWIATDAVKALESAGVTVKKDGDKVSVDVKKAEPEDPNEAIFKGMSKEARTRFEAMEAENKANAEELAKQRDERETEAISKRISENFGDVLPAAEFAPVLKKLGKEDPDGLEALEKRLTALQEQLAKSELFKELGRTGDGGDEDSIAKVESLAQARAAEKSISIHKARVEIRQENRDLANAEADQRREAKKAA